MSSRFEISSINKGLFNRDILLSYVTDDHRDRARKIKKHFQEEKKKNPYRLSAKQLNALSEDDTIDYYIKPILEKLGYVYRKKHQDLSSSFPDIWLFNIEPEETKPKYLQANNLTILEAKKYRVDLDIGDSRKETPPEQLSGYINTNLKSNPYKRWGILSNGYKWRLYTDSGTDRYIEFDIDHALEDQEELELFCLIFSPESFKINKDRSDLLSKMNQSSLDSWISITGEIQERGNKVLLELVNGFYESGSSLDQAKELAYNTLFKLLYTLYIESKHLIPKGRVKYYDYSLRVLLHDIYETTLEEYDISTRLNKLFKIYKLGNSVLPPKFGGEHFEQFNDIKMKNKWLKQALEMLTVFSADRSEIKFFDYSSLNVELIGNIYEGTLALLFVKKGTKIEIEKIKKKKGTTVHSTGTTYTPPNVVKYLINEVFPDNFKKIPTVCDPSCGSGHFLVQALRYLSEKISSKITGATNIQAHKKVLALECLYGVDINPLATKLTRLMLVIETSEKGVPAADFRNNIKNFNSLTTKWLKSKNWLKEFNSQKLLNEGGFDFVVGNPPYVRADEPGQQDNRNEIVKSGQYKFLYKKWDLFIPFIELAMGLTNDTKGAIAYVVSDGITYAPYAEECTKELSKSRKVRFVSHFTDKFENWAFPATCFVIDQSANYSKSERRNHDGNDPLNISSSEQTDNAFFNSEKADAIEKSTSWGGLRIGDAFYVSVGMVLNSHEKLKSKKISFVKDDLLIRGKADKNHPIVYVDNEDIGPGNLLRTDRFIEYGSGLRAPDQVRRPTFPELHNGPRVFLSSSKKDKSAAVVNDDIIVSHNTIVCKRWSELIGVENRSVSAKAKLSSKLKKIRLPKGINDRVLLEALSGIVTEELILGIFLSDYFKRWCIADKRHKHVIVPDVISEMPLPILFSENKALKKVKYDLKFQSILNKLKRENPTLRYAEVTYHICQIVRQISGNLYSANSSVQLKVSYLNELVELMYAPVVSGNQADKYNLEKVISDILATVKPNEKLKKISGY